MCHTNIDKIKVTYKHVLYHMGMLIPQSLGISIMSHIVSSNCSHIYTYIKHEYYVSVHVRMNE